MAGRRPEEIAGEHALRAGETDRLGFSEVARRIANSIVDRASIEGLVIGLDGQWGSGKSSLLHLIERSLGELPEAKRPTIISFRPWLIGNRDALLTGLFGELAAKSAEVQLARGDATATTKKKAKQAAERMRKFARSLSRMGELANALADFTGHGKFLASLLGAADKAAEKGEETDLATLKAQIEKDLRDLDHRFIITIDDVDRLEPKEVIEVLRLVRSVADFPNVVYLLCYDAERLAEAIQASADIERGDIYLEKIVQLTVMVPKPEPFELRQWFDEEVVKLIGDPPFEVRERLKRIVDQEGGNQLRTPRSVVRTLDSIRFFWPALRNERIDVADLVWLQLVKDGSPKLYRWVEEYVASAAAVSFGTANVSENGRKRRLETLVELDESGQLSDIYYRQMLSDILPGIEPSYDKDGPPVSLHNKVPDHARQAAVDGRRLASPDHYRLYFSLIGPTHAITQAGYDDFWLALDAGAEQAANVLLALHRQMAVGSMRKSDVLLERLRSIDQETWTATRARNLLLAFGRMMDEAYRIDPSEEFFIVSSWDRAERLIPELLGHIDDTDRDALVKELFAASPSIGWITSIVRRETFAHGLYGDQRRPTTEWYLTEAQFSIMRETMLHRYRALDADLLSASPRPLHVLFAWQQLGDDEGPRELVGKSIASDDGLIRVLSLLTSSSESSDRGRYITLTRKNVESFLDWDSALPRLVAIADSGPADLREVAKKLKDAANADRE